MGCDISAFNFQIEDILVGVDIFNDYCPIQGNSPFLNIWTTLKKKSFSQHFTFTSGFILNEMFSFFKFDFVSLKIILWQAARGSLST